MKLKNFLNNTCHRANEAFYCALFGVFVGLFFLYLERGKVAPFSYTSTACFQTYESIFSCPSL